MYSKCNRWLFSEKVLCKISQPQFSMHRTSNTKGFKPLREDDVSLKLWEKFPETATSCDTLTSEVEFSSFIDEAIGDSSGGIDDFLEAWPRIEVLLSISIA